MGDYNIFHEWQPRINAEAKEDWKRQEGLHSLADALYREDKLQQELADMERRNQEAESRHEELTNKLPEATRPLLRQIEGMQRTASAHAQAWQAAEQALQSRLADAEARAASAGELCWHRNCTLGSGLAHVYVCRGLRWLLSLEYSFQDGDQAARETRGKRRGHCP